MWKQIRKQSEPCFKIKSDFKDHSDFFPFILYFYFSRGPFNEGQQFFGFTKNKNKLSQKLSLKRNLTVLSLSNGTNRSEQTGLHQTTPLANSVGAV